MPELTYNFKRIERYRHAEPPVFLARIWTWLAIFFVGILLGSALIFTNIGQLDTRKVTTEDTIAKNEKDPFTDKLAYGIVDASNAQLKNVDGKQPITLPKYAVATLTGENTTRYRIDVDGQTYTAKKEQFQYLNPAALYNNVERDQLAPYMKSNYINYVDYFNGQLHNDHDDVNDTLVPEKAHRFVEQITQQPVYMLFNERNQLTGFKFPMVKKDEFKKKFNVNGQTWIGKAEDGYYIADIQNGQWIYIKL